MILWKENHLFWAGAVVAAAAMVGLDLLEHLSSKWEGLSHKSSESVGHFSYRERIVVLGRGLLRRSPGYYTC